MDNLALAVNHAVHNYRLAQLRLGLLTTGGMGLDAKRNNAWCEYGFPEVVTDLMLYRLYRRGGLAHGAVNKVIGTVWQTDPWIIEGEPKEESEKQTRWESNILDTLTPRFWRSFAEADRRRFSMRWSALLLHVRDGEPWKNPVKKGKSLEKLTPVWSNAIRPIAFESDEQSANYSLPTMWQYTEEAYGGFPGRIVDIHPDRIFLLGDYSSNTIGWLEPAYNAFVSIEKVEGGSGESFLKNASRQISMNFDKEINLGNVASLYGIDIADLQEKFNEAAREINRGNDQMLVTQGASVTPLVANVADPSPTYNVNLQTAAAALDIPTKILVGMQTGERASTEDQRYFNARCQSERKNRSFEIEECLQHLIRIGIIDPISSSTVMWDNLSEQTQSEQLDSASKMSSINQTALAAGEAIFTPDEIRVAAGFEPLGLDSLPEEEPDEEPDEDADIPVEPE